MLILAVDTSTRTGSAALLRDSQVLAEVPGYEETPYSTRLFRAVALLQERESFRLDQIDVFAVAAGPGSFTGFRGRLIAGTARAEVHGKPLTPVIGLAAIASDSLLGDPPQSSGARAIARVLDALLGHLFGAM